MSTYFLKIFEMFLIYESHFIFVTNLKNAAKFF
jgi:hypothetical protein